MRKMLQAVEFVRNHPDCPKLWVARAVGPNGSTLYGYRTVNRAIKRNLIKAEWVGNKYKLKV